MNRRSGIKTLLIISAGTALLPSKTSLLNEWHQFHNCPNVFVTDGACMTSTSTQNPSLTYMAMTARAADYAAFQLKKGEI